VATGEHAIDEVGATALAEFSGPLGALYRECFSEEPWVEPEERFARFTDTFAEHLATPGAHGVLARAGRQVAGVVYGWPAPIELPDTPFYANVFGAVDPAVRDRLRPPALEVVELMVARRHRGRGLARALLRRFVRGHDRAWLCTHSEAPACGLYESEGWTAVGSFTGDNDTPLVIYLLDRS